MSSFNSQIKACIAMHNDTKQLNVVNNVLRDLSNTCQNGAMSKAKAISSKKKIDLIQNVLEIHNENINSAMKVMNPTRDMTIAFKKYDKYNERKNITSTMKKYYKYNEKNNKYNKKY